MSAAFRPWPNQACLLPGGAKTSETKCLLPWFLLFSISLLFSHTFIALKLNQETHSMFFIICFWEGMLWIYALGLLDVRVANHASFAWFCFSLKKKNIDETLIIWFSKTPQSVKGIHTTCTVGKRRDRSGARSLGKGYFHCYCIFFSPVVFRETKSWAST